MLKSLLKNIIRSKSVKMIVSSGLFNKYKISKNNELIREGQSALYHCSIKIYGKNNKIFISDKTVLKNCTIQIFGNDNNIYIGEKVAANKLNLWIEDEHNTIRIGERTTVHGSTQIACIEGTSVTIGEDCMFSSNISLVTGDSHSIINEKGHRINPSEDIHIGNHVWIGKENTILKGVTICDNSIVGAKSLVNKSFNEENIIIAGIPANIVKSNINWLRERI